jgi:hypothetical protein
MYCPLVIFTLKVPNGKQGALRLPFMTYVMSSLEPRQRHHRVKQSLRSEVLLLTAGTIKMQEDDAIFPCSSHIP